MYQAKVSGGLLWLPKFLTEYVWASIQLQTSREDLYRIGKGANEEMKTKYNKKETLKNLALTALLSVNKHQDTPWTTGMGFERIWSIWYEYSYCKNSVYSMSLRLNMVELNHILGFYYQSTMSNNWPSRPGPVSQSELGKPIVGCFEWLNWSKWSPFGSVLILYVCLWGQPILILWKVDCLKIQHVSHCFSICSCYYTIFHHQFSSGFPQKWCYHQAAFYMIGGMSDVKEKATVVQFKLWGLNGFYCHCWGCKAGCSGSWEVSWEALRPWGGY